MSGLFSSSIGEKVTDPLVLGRGDILLGVYSGTEQTIKQVLLVTAKCWSHI